METHTLAFENARAIRSKLTLNQFKYLKTCRVLLGTPAYGGMVHSTYADSLVRLKCICEQLGLNVNVSTLSGESLITRARNTLAASAVEQGCTHLFFVDADVGFEPITFLTVLAQNKPVAAAAYPLKRYSWDKMIHQPNHHTLPSSGMEYVWNGAIGPPQQGWIKVREIGTGFMCIQRQVLDTLIRNHPERRYRPDVGVYPQGVPWHYDLFRAGVDPTSRRYLSEDWQFCHDVTAAGFEVWLWLNSRLSHTGTHTWQGDMLETLQIRHKTNSSPTKICGGPTRDSASLPGSGCTPPGQS